MFHFFQKNIFSEYQVKVNQVKMQHYYAVCSLLLIFSGVIADQHISSSASEDSLVKKLSAVCGKDGIKVSVRFRHPFHGVVYSDGHYDTPKCIFIDQEKNASSFHQRSSSFSGTRFSFLIPADECGTKFHDPGSILSSLQNDNGTTSTTLKPVNDFPNEVYMENTVMFQQNHLIQEQGDLAQTLRCVWQKEIRRPLHATLPLTSRSKLNNNYRHIKNENKQLENSIGTSVVSTSRPITPSVFPSKYFTLKDYSYLTSSQQRHADIRKKFFQPKGQVESVSYFGSSRRSGKSLNYQPIQVITSPSHEFHEKISGGGIRYRSSSNFTALPFKADKYAKSSGDSVGACTFTLAFFVMLMNRHYEICLFK